ncbi:phage regulatory protein, rha family [Devosia psychrophila]|uniref:Phage regulatory protein, rha family n=2 Tax=Devosia psychrophila TaxID=728005 RepID=A0A1I1GMM0_9HYPH|nr:phage regulatory protein, rha family [Devosia psychrophila]
MPRGGTRAEETFNMTKDGFTFLAMGFTGKPAAQFKEAYIARFNELEQGRATTSSGSLITPHLRPKPHLYRGTPAPRCGGG